MVIMKIFSTSQNGSTRLSTHISSKWTFLSNEINSACRTAIRHVRSLARRRDSRNDDSMNATPTYHSVIYNTTENHTGVTAPVLARKAFVVSSNMSWNENETISTQLVTAEEQTEEATPSDMAPVKISWRVNKAENTTSCNNETVTTQDNQTEEQAKRAGRLDMNSLLLLAYESHDTEDTSLSDDQLLANLKNDFLLSKQNKSKETAKAPEKYVEGRQRFYSEIYNHQLLYDTIPENEEVDSFSKVRSEMKMTNSKELCERLAEKARKHQDSSSNESFSSSSETALPAFHKDLPTSSPMCSIEQGKAPVYETANVGEITSQFKDGIEVSPAKGEQLAATIDQAVADQLNAKNHIGTGSLTTNDTTPCLLTLIDGRDMNTPEKQKAAGNSSKGLSGLFKTRFFTPKKSVPCDSDESYEETPLSTPIKPLKKPGPLRRLAQFVAPSTTDHNNNDAKL